MHLTRPQVIDRLSFGPNPQLVDEIQHQHITDWINKQLNPGEESEQVQSRLATFDTLRLSPAQLFERYWLPFKQRKNLDARKHFRMQVHDLYLQSAAARLWRASNSPWQLRELLVDFWFNHFNVFAHKGLCNLWTGSYEDQAIRPNVFRRFSDMLMATAKHPAMLFYLDNWMNTMPNSAHARGRMKGFNENYARELMELHTIGLHYTQKDVIGATRLLTGWGLQRHIGFHFDPLRHDFSPQTILGRRFDGGEAAITDFLHYLARHPNTAQHIAFELAQYFVADQPPADLVRHMRTRFLDSEGDLRAVTEAMIEHPEFALAAARHDKFRTPYRYILALIRASGKLPQNSRPLIGTLYQLGQPLYGCVTPNGFANTQDEWLSPDALTARLNFAVALGSGYLPINHSADAMMMAMDATPQTRQRRQKHEPVDPATVLNALGHTLTDRTIAVAKLAPPRLRAAVLLGSPEMQYC